MYPTANLAGARRARRIRGLISGIERRIRHQRELLWNPRLEIAAARQIARSRRQLELLRRIEQR
ncbi:MAG: hypothetical protein ACRDHD_08445 [Candidatus Limnocylindria bacterium]